MKCRLSRSVNRRSKGRSSVESFEIQIEIELSCEWALVRGREKNTLRNFIYLYCLRPICSRKMLNGGYLID